LDKFLAFAESQGTRYWQEVGKDLVMRYGSWLDQHDYHPKTHYTEVTIVKQIVKWMVVEGLLPPTSLIVLKMRKPHGTSTYCYTVTQVQAMLELCRSDRRLHWLADVIVALATTGLRIGELAGLRWSDIDLVRGRIRLKDTSRNVRKSE